ncbi:MAG TPA: ABC transporter permease [Terracidiphilus sp.]|jgi:putative ABC transport system permease protein
MRKLFRRINYLLNRRRYDAELEADMEFHREMAARAGHNNFGNMLRLREQAWDAWGWTWLDCFLQDTHYAFRQFRRKPGFVIASLITLALGIGATTTIYSVADSLLVRPLPYPNSRQIVRVWNTFAPRGMMEIPASEPEFLEYRQSRSFEHFAGFSTGTVTLTGSGDPLRTATSWGTSEFFQVMGTEPLLGRVFTADEFQPGHSSVAVLSHRLWQSRFGSRPDILGKSILLNGQSCTVVGIMPRSFNFPSDDTDVWQPLPIPPASANIGNHYLNLIGELKPGPALQQARSEMATVLDRIEHKYPSYYGGAVGLGVSLIPLRQQMVGNVRPTVLVLLTGVGFLLLIACTNVASLLLARGEDRRQEIATRAALGATPMRILYQVLIENVLLFLGGGALGLVLAFACLKVVSAGDYLHVAEMGGVGLDFRVLAFAAIVSLVTGLLFGLVPALKASRSNISESLKTGGRDAMGSHHRARIRSFLVISEIAFSLVLLTGAGLMISSLRELLNVNLGFNPENVITMRLSVPEARYSIARTASFYRQLQERVRTLPGVQAVAIVNQLPMSDITANASFDVEGRPTGNSDINVADTQIISPDYFRAMGISLMRGRFLSDEDANLPPTSVIVNQTLAGKIWPGKDPLGKRIRLGPSYPWLSVVGVVADIKNHGPNVATKPEMYLVDTGQPFQIWVDLRSMTLVVRTAVEPQQMISAIRGRLKSMDPDLAVFKVSTLERLVSSSTSQTRFPTLSLSLFASIALFLSAIGVYGVLAYTVAQSRHDIGVRMALGAQQVQILRFFLSQGLRWALIGGCVGMIAAVALVRFMRSMLFEVSAYDPRIFVTVGLGLFVVVLLACAIPALRAAKVDPLIALKSD